MPHTLIQEALARPACSTSPASREAIFGIGHGAIDGGAGYTYFDPQTGPMYTK